MVESEVMAALRRYLKALDSCGIHASRLVVFGSYARGNADESGNIDLVVIAPEFDGPRDKTLIEKIWQATMWADKRIEPVACGQREWETDQSRPVLEIARREGIVITA